MPRSDSVHEDAPTDAVVDRLAARVQRAVRPGERLLLGIAGSPGSGKTTLARAIVASIERRHAGTATYLPMDGFHLANSTLDRLGIRDRKGAVDTFDGWGFLALLERVRAETEHPVYAPSFRREVDEGIAGELAVEPGVTIVVVEGNYLLADGEPWGRVRERLDAAWFCATPAAVREERLIDRHTRHGRTPEAAAAWAREVDGVNAELIEASRVHADLVISGVTGEILEARGD